MYVFSLVICLWDAPNRSEEQRRRYKCSFYSMFPRCCCSCCCCFLISVYSIISPSPHSACSACIPSTGDARNAAAAAALAGPDDNIPCTLSLSPALSHSSLSQVTPPSIAHSSPPSQHLSLSLSYTHTHPCSLISFVRK